MTRNTRQNVMEERINRSKPNGSFMYRSDILRSAHRAQFCAFCGSQNKQRGLCCTKLNHQRRNRRWDQWQLDWLLPQYVHFPLSVSFHQCSILIFINSYHKDKRAKADHDTNLCSQMSLCLQTAS